MQDHSYCTSPSKVIPQLKKSLEKKKKKIRALTSKNLRKEKTIKGLVKKLENKKQLSKEQSQSLLSNFGHMTRDIFLNEQKNANKSTTSTYAVTINQFAITLHSIVHEHTSLYEDPFTYLVHQPYDVGQQLSTVSLVF